MHVIIEPKHGIPGNRLPSNPVRAKSSIEDSLREFVGDDGSQGRLAYDLAEVDETVDVVLPRQMLYFSGTPSIRARPERQ